MSTEKYRLVLEGTELVRALVVVPPAWWLPADRNAPRADVALACACMRVCVCVEGMRCQDVIARVGYCFEPHVSPRPEPYHTPIHPHTHAPIHPCTYTPSALYGDMGVYAWNNMQNLLDDTVRVHIPTSPPPQLVNAHPPVAYMRHR